MFSHSLKPCPALAEVTASSSRVTSDSKKKPCACAGGLGQRSFSKAGGASREAQTLGDSASGPTASNQSSSSGGGPPGVCCPTAVANHRFMKGLLLRDFALPQEVRGSMLEGGQKDLVQHANGRGGGGGQGVVR